jgi:hypothetical protein
LREIHKKNTERAGFNRVTGIMSEKNLSWGISEEQSEQLSAWIKKHRHPKKYKGAIGGHITYSFTDTSLGTVMSVKCATCEGKLDFSDYDKW